MWSASALALWLPKPATTESVHRQEREVLDGVIRYDPSEGRAEWHELCLTKSLRDQPSVLTEGYFPMLSNLATVILRGLVFPVSQFDMLLTETPRVSASPF